MAGKFFTLLPLKPLKDRVSSGRAHTKNFVTLDTEDRNMDTNEDGGAIAEEKDS